MSYKARIKFDNKEWLVVENLIYEGIKYFYIIEDISQKIEREIRMENYIDKLNVEFIYETEEGKYRNVVNEELKQKLFLEVSLKYINNKN